MALNNDQRAAILETLGVLGASVDPENHNIHFGVNAEQNAEIKEEISAVVEGYIVPQLLFLAGADENLRQGLDIRNDYENVREGEDRITEQRWVDAAKQLVARHEHHLPRVRVGHAREYVAGPVEWLQVIHKINDLEPDTFGEPLSTVTLPAGEYSEFYRTFVVALHDEGKGDATFQPLSEHALDLLEKALQETGVTVVSRS